MKISEIKESLEKGDIKIIARCTEYSPETVRKVLSGDRVNDKIVKAAEMLVEGRKSLEEQISIMASI